MCAYWCIHYGSISAWHYCGWLFDSWLFTARRWLSPRLSNSSNLPLLSGVSQRHRAGASAWLGLGLWLTKPASIRSKCGWINCMPSCLSKTPSGYLCERRRLRFRAVSRQHHCRDARSGASSTGTRSKRACQPPAIGHWLSCKTIVRAFPLIDRMIKSSCWIRADGEHTTGAVSNGSAPRDGTWWRNAISGSNPKALLNFDVYHDMLALFEIPSQADSFYWLLSQTCVGGPANWHCVLIITYRHEKLSLNISDQQLSHRTIDVSRPRK